MLLILSRFVNKHGHHRPFLFLIGRFKKILFPETAKPIELKLVRKHLGKVIYKDCKFHPDLLTNMAESTNQKQEWPVVAMFFNGSKLNE
jgi:hypothetical protein